MAYDKASEQAKTNGWRVAVLVLGVAAVVSGFVLWLTPALHTMTTADENTTTTVIDSAGHKSTTAVRKSTTTTTPGVGKSDAMQVALFTFGVGLLVVASLWDRIQEFAIGGVSITLIEAEIETPAIALMEATADYVVSSLNSTIVSTIVEKVAEDGRRSVAQVDLRAGDLWAPTNLRLYMLLLAGRSSVEVVVFRGQGHAGPETYLGAASVAWLADRIKAEDVDLFAAYRGTETMPLPPPTAAAHAMGETFWNRLPPTRQQQPETDRVDLSRLYKLAGQALITDRVEVNGEQTLSKTQQRAILEFPLNYVPITDHHGRLHNIVDKRQVAKMIARSAIGL